MITRIFRVRINPQLRADFEAEFSTLSVQEVESSKGALGISIGRPTKWAPDEYLMISRWQDEQALHDFAGPDWHRAVIPQGMERFLVECWVHHYQEW